MQTLTIFYTVPKKCATGTLTASVAHEYRTYKTKICYMTGKSDLSATRKSRYYQDNAGLYAF